MNGKLRNIAKVGSALAVLALALACFGCGATSQPATTKVMALKGPTGIGMAHMMADKSSSYSCTYVGTPDEVVSAVSSGSVDIAAVPTNLAATLYAKTKGGVKMISVDTYGSLYLLQNGKGINSLSDLRGKTVYATGQGANPQYVFEYLLEKAGLKVGTDVQVKYLSEHAELAAKMAAGSVDIGLLPEPFVSTVLAKDKNARIAVDLNDAWKTSAGGKMTLGCVIARTSFIEQNPQAVKQFLADLKTSIDEATSDVSGTAQLCVQQGILADATIAEKAIPRCQLVCLTGQDMKPATEPFLKVLYQAAPAAVGGALPDEAFYYQG